MSSPYDLIERALAIHGDALFRLALLLAGDDQGAEALLRACVRDLIDVPPPVPPDEMDLVARLSAVAARVSRPRHAPRLPTATPLLYGSLFRLTSAQRLALGLHLFMGYDVARVARVSATELPAARAELLAAMRAIAPATNVTLTDQISDDACLAVRDVLADPAGRLRHTPATRGHLANCAYCRAFDQAWGELSQAVELALRTALRDRNLPASLEARLLATSRPARHFRPQLRVLLPPLAVLLLIAVLVLPGVTQPGVTVVNHETATPQNPQALIARALALHLRPPEDGGPIWHARYQTFWYFDNNTLAPLHADIWLDRTNPARHRLQITHADGGAPYELQLGNGSDRLSYALNPLYVPVLYGSLSVPDSHNQPALISVVADAPAQSRALTERSTYGIWNIPLFYLHQAQAAPDLHVLGRQRDGERSVQILSFSGISPMGLPTDAPGAATARVTVLLALDLADGRLRRASELAGPGGSTQTSQITWKLLDEQRFDSSAAAGSPFEITQAWNGQGQFPEKPTPGIADVAMPLIPVSSLGSNIAKFPRRQRASAWVSATPPVGIDRALLIWPPSEAQNGFPPQALIYLGPDRRLILQFNTTAQMVDAEQMNIGAWSVQLKPGHSRSYRAVLFIQNQGETIPRGRILLDAYGFSHAELLAVITSLQPLDAKLLAAQAQLFVRPGGE